MGSPSDCSYPILAEVRTEESKKLLFQLVDAKDEIAIALKCKGDKTIHYVPFRVLLRIFCPDEEAIRHVTRLETYDEEIKKRNDEKIE